MFGQSRRLPSTDGEAVGDCGGGVGSLTAAAQLSLTAGCCLSCEKGGTAVGPPADAAETASITG